MEHLKVGEREQQDLLALVGTYKADVVEKP